MTDHLVAHRPELSVGDDDLREETRANQNTVVYRVKRAEELLCRRVTESPIELTLAAALGSAVLSD
jgi:hypothetical protein